MKEPTIVMQCPKCGTEMTMLTYSTRLHNGIKTVSMVCENCLHTEDVSLLVKKEE